MWSPPFVILSSEGITLYMHEEETCGHPQRFNEQDGQRSGSMPRFFRKRSWAFMVFGLLKRLYLAKVHPFDKGMSLRAGIALPLGSDEGVLFHQEIVVIKG